ncbi:Putative Transcription factor SPT8 [[Torrubiella] hemipterigena]|uniref:Putative Transcription factor SPT8 n=1 Tax=[Torrubiella] hemipterigena TaxID=1531966 RepID=A0A0A1TIQ5_9HYPO|nr:Putative Transcription factor SPT8 [[Torrubiella] hemipterigena]
MDDEDRFSASSPESDRDKEEQPEEQPEEEVDNDNDNDNENDDDQDDDDDDDNEEQEDGQDAAKREDAGKERAKSRTPAPPQPDWRPIVRPEILNATGYDIVPTMAVPQSTSINSLSVTPDLRYWFTGGSDGYIRKFDGVGTLNGKMPLTVAQRHSFVDSVVKACILMSYWENDEPGMSEQVLSPVYSLAVESKALWLLSGLESGAINLQSVRHEEGKKICSLQQHTNAVSVLTMAPDERSVLSGSWDKSILDWDLDTGAVIRNFLGTAGQISSVELRPASGAPVPADADDQPMSTTMSTNNAAPFTNGTSSVMSNGMHVEQEDIKFPAPFATEAAAQPQPGAASPGNESLFGGSDAGSLFGDTAGDAPFGADDDQFGEGMGVMGDGDQEGGMDHSADMTMADMDEPKVEAPKEEAAPATEAVADATATTEEPPKTEPDAAAQPADGAATTAAAPADDAMDVDSAPEPLKSEPADSTQPTEPNTTQGSFTTTTQTETLPPTEPATEDAPMTEEATESTSAPILVVDGSPKPPHDPTQTSATTFLSSAMDGTIRIWDRRVPAAVARISPRTGVPPWCMSACWSPDGNMIYAGRRNSTVEEYDIRHAKRGWEPERTLKFPNGSGAVSAVQPMVNGRHLVCASHDILRLYDLKHDPSGKGSTVPFLIVPGPPRAGVISTLYIDKSSRFMLSAAGTRGWNGTSTEVLIGYEINVTN